LRRIGKATGEALKIGLPLDLLLVIEQELGKIGLVRLGHIGCSPLV
jgi:hypothetical protein